jgi:hypothetical protein
MVVILRNLPQKCDGNGKKSVREDYKENAVR